MPTREQRRRAEQQRLRAIVEEVLLGKMGASLKEEPSIELFQRCVGPGKSAPVTAAILCRQLYNDLGCTQKVLAEKLGVRPSTVCRLLQVARAPAEVQEALKERKISVRDATAYGRQGPPRRTPPPRVATLDDSTVLPHPVVRVRAWCGSERRWEVVLRGAGMFDTGDALAVSVEKILEDLRGGLRKGLDEQTPAQ